MILLFWGRKKEEKKGGREKGKEKNNGIATSVDILSYIPEWWHRKGFLSCCFGFAILFLNSFQIFVIEKLFI